jgi:hypothetical protein
MMVVPLGYLQSNNQNGKPTIYLLIILLRHHATYSFSPHNNAAEYVDCPEAEA